MYRAPREVHEARVYTEHHRLYGLIHLLPALGVADYLNQDRPFFPMTGVLVYAFGLEHPPRLEDLQGELPLLALRKEKIAFLVGGKPAEPKTPLVHKARRLLFLFPGYLLLGELLLPRGVRLSDYLSQARPFQTLYRAGVYLLRPGRPVRDLEPLERHGFLTLNLHRAEGVAEVPQGVEETHLTLFG